MSTEDAVAKLSIDHLGKPGGLRACFGDHVSVIDPGVGELLVQITGDWQVRETVTYSTANALEADLKRR